jgi:hypothetical protein
MKVFNFEDIKKIQADQQYKYVGLFDQSGTQIIPFNPNRTSVSQRLREIETRLISQGLNDGYYFVKCKNSTGKQVKADEYLVYKGEQLSENAPIIPQIVEKPVFQPEVLTYDGALKLQIELERYKLENASLKREIDSLNQQIQSIESEQLLSEEEEEPGMIDNAKSFLSEMVSYVAPLLDKHFELKQQALGLKALELQHRLDPKDRRRPRTNPVEPIKKHSVNDYDPGGGFIEDYILTKQDDPDTYEILAELYNTATDQEDFLRNLKEVNEELFNELDQWNKN